MIAAAWTFLIVVLVGCALGTWWGIRTGRSFLAAAFGCGAVIALAVVLVTGITLLLG